MNIPWNPKILVLIGLIRTLYELPDCMSGGLCHIVTDDDNIRDSDLKWVIDFCKDNPDRIDCELSTLICELMLQLSIEQRAALFVIVNGDFLVLDEADWKWFVENHEDDIQKFIDDQCDE